MGANAAQDRERLAADALRRIGRALVLDSDPRLYALRASSAVAVGNPHYIVESFRFLVATMRVRVRSSERIPAQEAAIMGRNLTSMAERLQGEVERDAPRRAAGVLRDIEALAAQLDQSSQP